MSIPSILIALDSLELSAVSKLRIRLSSGFQSNQFDLTIPNVGGQHNSLFREPVPDDPLLLKDAPGKRVSVFISATPPSSLLTSPSSLVFSGCSDVTCFSYSASTISIEGRDWSGILIDETMTAALAAKLTGKTAGVIVQTVAKQYGFTADVEATTKVWSDANVFPAGVSVWSCLCDLAAKEGLSLYCTPERVLVFRKRRLPDSTTRTWHIPPPTGRLDPATAAERGPLPKFYQDETLSLALKVKVVGYDPKKKRRITFTAESRYRNRDHYKIVEIIDHGLGTKDMVRRRAETALLDISKDLLTGEMTIPLDADLRPDQAISFVFDGEQDQSFAGRYLFTGVEHEIAEDGSSTSTLTFASKPLAESRDMTIEEVI